MFTSCIISLSYSSQCNFKGLTIISESIPIAECSDEHAAVANSSMEGSGKALRAFALAA